MGPQKFVLTRFDCSTSSSDTVHTVQILYIQYRYCTYCEIQYRGYTSLNSIHTKIQEILKPCTCKVRIRPADREKIDRQTGDQSVRQTYRHTDGHINRTEIDRQTNEHSDRQTNELGDRQTLKRT